MALSIRRSVPQDAEALWHIQRRAFLPDLEKYHDQETNPANESLERLKVKMERYLYFTILDGGTIIGGADVRQRDSCRYRLNRICVDPDFQDQGFGFQAIQLIERQLPDARTWDLDTPHLSFRNNHLYEKLGYRKVGEIVATELLTLFVYEKEVEAPVG